MNRKSRYIDGTDMTNEQMRYIPDEVISLSLDGAPITDKGISNLPFLHSIKSLNVSNTLITEKSLKVIATFTTLEKLWMSNIKSNDDYSLDTLVNLSFIDFGNSETEFIDYLPK